MTFILEPRFKPSSLAQRMTGLSLWVALAAVGGCSMFRQDITELGDTLADLSPAELPESLQPIAVVDRREVEAMYRSALMVTKDPEVRQQIQIRLADIDMATSEDKQIASEDGGRYFDNTISMYDKLIKLQESTTGMPDERLLYRVSKAYALDARMGESDAMLSALIAKHPESAFAAEAQFRRAEQAFGEQDYTKAHQLYTAVVVIGSETAFYLNALYMQGWSLFKQDKYHLALEPFAAVLDNLLPDNADIDKLSESQKNLLADTLKVTGFTFSYLEGPASIAALADTRGERAYQHLLYRQLGDFYLDKKRYRDAADTYEAFITRYPNSDFSPELAVKAIAVFMQGNFPSEVLPAKEAYIQRFGLNSGYWQARTPEQRLTYSGTLATYLDEVSSYYHAEAQALASAQSSPKKNNNTALVAPEPYFAKAAAYYKEILTTFNNNPRQSELTFLMGEALHDAGQLSEAVTVYETVAFEYLDPKNGATAGYAAILTLDQQLADSRQTDDALAKLQQHRINSAISFADYYPADQRAVAVLTNAAERLYQASNREQAIIVANRLVVWQPPQSMDLQKTAWLVLAHSQFELNQYAAAEQAYRQALQMIAANDPAREPVMERIAASMYKQAEQQLVANEKPQAIERLLKIAASAPGTDIAINAQYDAASYLIELKEWSRAEQVLVGFKAQYPNHELTKTITPKLAVIYQETAQWDKAAEQLAFMSQGDADPETRRNALYLSAELYEKSKRSGLAEQTYNDYIKRYPEPFDLALEARIKLLELTKARGAVSEQERMMREFITLDAKAGSARTPRSTALAAQSQSYFAAQELVKFQRIRLAAPIKNSLKAKRAAMDQTLASYKRVIDYGVAEYVTEANHHIGEVYAQLYQDLLSSERPKGLDDLAMEQYEIMLEEQAYPFKGKAVDMLTLNAERSWQGFYDKWVKESFSALAELLPARYGKYETPVEVSRGVH
ncbi:MAG: tetratricopeptide repeat protein [Marinagarivorans sp.]|nr:tetratricopeptide repeat protein [Marinagarivorans sp.]